MDLPGTEGLTMLLTMFWTWLLLLLLLLTILFTVLPELVLFTLLILFTVLPEFTLFTVLPLLLLPEFTVLPELLFTTCVLPTPAIQKQVLSWCGLHPISLLFPYSSFAEAGAYYPSRVENHLCDAWCVMLETLPMEPLLCWTQTWCQAVSNALL